MDKVKALTASHPPPYTIYPRDRSGTVRCEDADELMQAIEDLQSAGQGVYARVQAGDRASCSLSIPGDDQGREASEPESVATIRELRRSLASMADHLLKHSEMSIRGIAALTATLEAAQQAVRESHDTILALTVQSVAEASARQPHPLMELIKDEAALTQLSALISSATGKTPPPLATLTGLKRDLQQVGKLSPADAHAVRRELLNTLLPGVDVDGLLTLAAAMKGE